MFLLKSNLRDEEWLEENQDEEIQKLLDNPKQSLSHKLKKMKR
jgi:hypothetical protein